MSRPSPDSRRSVRYPTPEKPGRRQRHHAEIEQRLVCAALELFATRGLQATTIHDITEAADVGKGTFFNYFCCKEHVLVTLYERRISAIDCALATVREGRGTVRQVLRDLLTRPVEGPDWSPELFHSLVLGLVLGDPTRGLLLQRLNMMRRRLVELLAVGQERGEIRSDSPASELARMLHGLLFSGLFFWSLRPEAPLGRLRAANFMLFWSSVAAAPTVSRKAK